MAKTNVLERTPAPLTHEGAQAARINAEQQLRRSVLATMLWESQFYEDGQTIADRIAELVAQVPAEKVAALAVEAREKQKLRHVPLWLVRAMAGGPQGHRLLVAATLARVIQRADELGEFVSLYWKDGRAPLSAQVKKGLAEAFGKFGEYDLAKYNRDEKVKLRDVLFLCHAKPKDADQDALWKRLVAGELAPPDTWEVALSGGGEKLATWTRLLEEKKLGALAFIRNLRNMKEAEVPKKVVEAYAETVRLDRVLPFRFVAAARAVPGWADICDTMLLRAAKSATKLPGKTVLVVDVSGSMYGGMNVSKNSDMTRVEAAGALAAIARESCEDARIYATAGNDYSRVHATAECPAYRGMALVETFTQQGYASKLGGGGIFLVQCLEWIKQREKTADRIIVLTDEQDCDTKLKPESCDAFGTYNYLINVASAQNGIGYKPKFVHIDGWSESVLEYVAAAETPTQ